jgi:hemerythrin
MKTKWDHELDTGNLFIDQQHQEIFQRVNNLIDAIKLGKGKEETRKMLAFLSDYIFYHFEAEEKYMRLQNYPGIELQVSEHKKFIVELNNIKSEFETTDFASGVADQMKTGLVKWLEEHVLKSDRDFANFIKKNPL